MISTKTIGSHFNVTACRTVNTKLIPLYFLTRPVGSVTYPRDRGRLVTCLDGKTAYLEVPAVDLRSTSFSITCWVQIMDTGVMNHIYSDWTSPFQFRFYVYGGNLMAELRGKGHLNTFVHLTG
jgi:hypothetical protein